MSKLLTKEDARNMNYVELISSLGEINRPPGGKDSIRRIAQNAFLTSGSEVLDVGCNTGYSSFEIAHLMKCHVTGVDISHTMIQTADKLKAEDRYSDLLSFKVADGMNLPFKDESFDLVLSGGSTAFIDDKVLALQEYARVAKQWGFIADVNFYYHTDPPKELLASINELLDIDIQPWQRAYWVDIYENVGLEKYYTYDGKVYVPSVQEIQKYCQKMSQNENIAMDAQKLVYERLLRLMTLFAKNHEYMDYGVFIFRKRPEPEQVSLFGA